MTRQIRSEARTGFTLVELLVVLAIIAVLLSMTLGAVQQFRKTGGAKVTESNIKLVKTLLERQWSTVSEKAQRETITTLSTIMTNFAGTDALKDLRARVIYVKLRQRQAFPMTFDEVLRATPPTGALPTLPAYKQQLNDLGYNSGNAASYPSVAVQNAVCLLMILEFGPGGGGATNNELTGATAKLVASPNLKDVRGLIDGYAQPLAFTRVPTGFANPNTTLVKQPVGNIAHPKGASDREFADPADRDGHLAVSAWVTAIGSQPIFTNVMRYTPVADKSYKIMPVVASGGMDLQLGLDPTNFGTTTASAITDNKYSTDY